ncbi:MAG TPA: quinolinate synthase NadA [Acidimicrobiales bacterium]|nr:quinolinate synthase NadA [Acidimicrobiales bacterium]
MIRLQTPLPEKYKAASESELASIISRAKKTLGRRVLILGHHYQRDEVMQWADARGDSFGLSKIAARTTDAEFIIFCGVHFMAESADILTSASQKVILPDLNAGCSMADMADIYEVEEAWERISDVVDVSDVIPITYINSSAALKAFVGRNGGSVCTSTNAKSVLTWALGLDGNQARGSKVLFFPDQHLGRNTAVQLGFSEADMALWNPKLESGGLEDVQIKESRFLLWKGHCSVHQRFSPAHIADFRNRFPSGQVIVHPECSLDVVRLADATGSTDSIISFVRDAPSGSQIAIGTEIHLVNRLAKEFPELYIECLDPLICPCSTMFRIDSAHLAWVLENLAESRVVNQIVVDSDVAEWAGVALSRMLEII